MKAPVVFDIDGVLANFDDGYTRLARDLGRPEPPPADVRRWGDLMDDAVWKAIKGDVHFWLGLKPLVKNHVFRRIHVMRDVRDVYFATNRVGLHVHWQTVEWLEVMGVSTPSVIVTGKKGEFANVVDAGYLIDDKAGNAVYAAYEAKRTTVCILDRPYNRFDPSILGSKVRRVDSVEEFLDLIDAEGR